MTSTFALLLLAVGLSLIFDIINGFHDAANSIATIVSTRVLKPKLAVLWMAFFNFFAMFVFAPNVAETISKIVKIESNDPNFIIVIICGLLAAILWNLLTWWLKLPTSSSHALIGGLSGAALAYGGTAVLRFDLLLKTVEFIFISPLIGFILGIILSICCYWIFAKRSPLFVDTFFRKGQLVSASLYSIGHGANDAQKTMGILLAILISAGILEKETTLSITNLKTLPIIFLSHLAMALGTLIGGWRIVKTMGMKITEIKPMGGFCAETAGAVSLGVATAVGAPVSTTHAIASAIIGVGTATKSFSKIKWGIANKIVWAWIFTLPGAGLIGFLLFLGTGKK